MRASNHLIVPSVVAIAAAQLFACGKPQQLEDSGQVAAQRSTPAEHPAATPAPAGEANELQAQPVAPAPAADVADRSAALAPRAGEAKRADVATRRRSGTGSGYGTIGRGGFGGATASIATPYDQGGNTESYRDYGVNKMTATADDRHSTFAVDVDTASYAIARRKILQGQAPPPAAVRVEEFVNYFGYSYPQPSSDRPFAVHMDAAPSPFTEGRHLLRVGLQGKQLANGERKPAHLVFLVDVSGSMRSPDKLRLAKRALRILVDNLRDGDTVALVTYAGSVRPVLEPTGLEHKARIMSAIEDLHAGGSTAMSSGLKLAYRMAAQNLSSDSVSRVIVLSDGDANVGATSHQQILKAIAGYVKEGVTLSTVGFGMGNYKDDMMEQLANKGNGNYFYIDDLMQARRVFQQQLGSALEVIAKDVKIQVEFDADVVSRYRLVGYENRDIADRDFRNDRVDAGEIGAGHTVTALYEIELRDQRPQRPLAIVRVRHKAPRGQTAVEHAYPFDADNLHASFADASSDFRFATAVMAGAEKLRNSEYAARWSIDHIRRIAAAAAGDSAERREYLDLLSRARPVLVAAD